MEKTKHVYLFQASDSNGFGPSDNVVTLGCYMNCEKAIGVLKRQLSSCWDEKSIERHSTSVFCQSVHVRSGKPILTSYRIVKIRLNAEDPWFEHPEPIILYKELA